MIDNDNLDIHRIKRSLLVNMTIMGVRGSYFWLICAVTVPVMIGVNFQLAVLIPISVFIVLTFICKYLTFWDYHLIPVIVESLRNDKDIPAKSNIEAKIKPHDQSFPKLPLV